ncbi:hypothetical protein [Streptomyces sp.]|uniref:hypothetical protein n=1 Tax=Streptomyces sp. TaxID=1931 RepID=UPI00281199EB|nr:hypothetical protein [Streptomyces sp.]
MTAPRTAASRASPHTADQAGQQEYQRGDAALLAEQRVLRDQGDERRHRAATRREHQGEAVGTAQAARRPQPPAGARGGAGTAARAGVRQGPADDRCPVHEHSPAVGGTRR